MSVNVITLWLYFINSLAEYIILVGNIPLYHVSIAQCPSVQKSNVLVNLKAVCMPAISFWNRI